MSSTTLEDGRPKAKDTVGSEEEVENGSKRRLSCSNDSELAVGESSSVSGGNDRPRASPGAATSGTESRDAVEDLITRHSQQIGVVMPDAASFAKVRGKQRVSDSRYASLSAAVACTWGGRGKYVNCIKPVFNIGEGNHYRIGVGVLRYLCYTYVGYRWGGGG